MKPVGEPFSKERLMALIYWVAVLSAGSIIAAGLLIIVGVIA